MSEINKSNILYFKQINKIPKLSDNEIKKLFKEYFKTHSKRIKQLLVEMNLKLVLPIAKKFLRPGLDIFDIIEDGNLGLIEAIERYNPRKTKNFANYAFYWIKRYILKNIKEQTKTIKIPQHIWDELRRWIIEWKELSLCFDRVPTIEEMKKNLHISTKMVWNIIEAIEIAQGISSLEAPLDMDEELSMKDILSDVNAELPEKLISQIKLNDEFEEALKYLDERERTVFKMRYGLIDNNIYTLNEIGKKLKLSKERVRQIEKKALKKFKWIAKKMQLL